MGELTINKSKSRSKIKPHAILENAFSEHILIKHKINNHYHCFKCIFLYCMTSKIGLIWLSAKLYRIPTISLHGLSLVWLLISCVKSYILTFLNIKSVSPYIILHFFLIDMFLLGYPYHSLTQNQTFQICLNITCDVYGSPYIWPWNLTTTSIFQKKDGPCIQNLHWKSVIFDIILILLNKPLFEGWPTN